MGFTQVRRLVSLFVWQKTEYFYQQTDSSTGFYYCKHTKSPHKPQRVSVVTFMKHLDLFLQTNGTFMKYLNPFLQTVKKVNEESYTEDLTLEDVRKKHRRATCKEKYKKRTNKLSEEEYQIRLRKHQIIFLQREIKVLNKYWRLEDASNRNGEDWPIIQKDMDKDILFFF